MKKWNWNSFSTSYSSILVLVLVLVLVLFLSNSSFLRFLWNKSTNNYMYCLWDFHLIISLGRRINTSWSGALSIVPARCSSFSLWTPNKPISLVILDVDSSKSPRYKRESLDFDNWSNSYKYCQLYIITEFCLLYLITGFPKRNLTNFRKLF